MNSAEGEVTRLGRLNKKYLAGRKCNSDGLVGEGRLRNRAGHAITPYIYTKQVDISTTKLQTKTAEEEQMSGICNI